MEIFREILKLIDKLIIIKNNDLEYYDNIKLFINDKHNKEKLLNLKSMVIFTQKLN